MVKVCFKTYAVHNVLAKDTSM